VVKGSGGPVGHVGGAVIDLGRGSTVGQGFDVGALGGPAVAAAEVKDRAPHLYALDLIPAGGLEALAGEVARG